MGKAWSDERPRQLAMDDVVGRLGEVGEHKTWVHFFSSPRLHLTFRRDYEPVNAASKSPQSLTF